MTANLSLPWSALLFWLLLAFCAGLFTSLFLFALTAGSQEADREELVRDTLADLEPGEHLTVQDHACGLVLRVRPKESRPPLHLVGKTDAAL